MRLLLAALFLFITAAPAAQDPMTAAKDLYAAAAFEEALVVLQAVKDRSEGDVIRQADQYRAFCLLALGRTTEAESAAEAAVRRDPLSTVDARDASPRVVTMFASVRRRVLPTLILENYRTARERMNQGDRNGGMQELERVRRMLDETETLKVSDDRLTDLSVLVDGFLELHRTAQAPPPPAVEPAAATVMAAATPILTAPPPRLSPSTPVAAPAPYSAEDTSVTPPIVVKQNVPEVILDTSSRRRSAVIEVTIDERGAVQRALMRESISDWVDTQLLKAARSWQYKPALRNGVPVPFVKVVGIAIGG